MSVDCHTMAEFAPPIGPNAGQERPLICLGDCRGKTLPATWMQDLARIFDKQFPGEVAVNEPFSGGYITQTHGQNSPWLQLEVSRTDRLSAKTKRQRILKALTEFCSLHR